MKKILSILLVIAMLSVLTVVCSAYSYQEYVEANGLYEVEANEGDICWAGGAEFDVKYIAATPKLDGVVNNNEYNTWDINKDYLTFVIGTSLDPADAYEQLTNLEYTAYSGWDGTYAYFAFVVDAPKNRYFCQPANNLYLFQHNCLQFAIANKDASGANGYHEFGLGAKDDDNSNLYYAWSGDMGLSDGEDYACNWDKKTEKVTYELRVNLKRATGNAIVNGGQARIGFVVSLSPGMEGSEIQLQYSHGITGFGNSANKDASVMGLATFLGLPDNVKGDVGGEQVEQEQDGFVSSIDFRKENTLKKFTTSENLKADYMTEGKDSFVRLTATGATPYISAADQPSGVNGDSAKYVAIHYRSSSDKFTSLGLGYSSAGADVDYTTPYYTTYEGETAADGQWHTLVIDMNAQTDWVQFIQNFTFFPFAEESNGESIDIAWVKFYTTGPAFDDMIEPEYTETTADPADDTTAVPEETTATPSVTTAAQTTVAPVTTASNNNSDGLSTGAIVAIVIAAVVVVGGGAACVYFFVIKKKK